MHKYRLRVRGVAQRPQLPVRDGLLGRSGSTLSYVLQPKVTPYGTNNTEFAHCEAALGMHARTR